MDLENKVVKLCIEGTKAEFERRFDSARDLYIKAWEASDNDYEACIAAHYVARFQPTLEETLRWNLIALRCAKRANDERVEEFYPSLYVNLGESYQKSGNWLAASKYYKLAGTLGLTHLIG